MARIVPSIPLLLLALSALAVGAGTAAAATTPVGQMTLFREGLDPTTEPRSITTGPDGNLWFTGWGNATVGRITPTGSITQATPPGSPIHPAGITAGPDGKVWFTDEWADTITSATPADAFAVFDITAGVSGVNARGITTGPDGNLWFTTSPGGGVPAAIGRMTPGGAVTYFTSGITGSTLWDITPGPDGNLWFTETDADRVARITTGGEVTEFSLTPGSSPSGITAGPDGNLWFTEETVDRIGRITMNGEVTEFGAGITAGATPTAIAAGADGNLWFTESGTERIGRITTAGQVTEFPLALPASASLDGITSGPDGNLWFTVGEPGGDADAIGRITSGAMRTLTLKRAGMGSGTVTSFPAGIDCGTTCTTSLDYGATITLTGTAASGSRFAGWSGGGCTGTPTCTVTMNQAQSVTATFTTPKLAATLLVPRTRLLSGQPARMGIRVSNPGDGAAASVRACLRLPANVVATRAPGARRAGRTLCFAVGDLAPGAQATRMITARAVSRRVVTRRLAGTATGQGMRPVVAPARAFRVVPLRLALPVVG